MCGEISKKKNNYKKKIKIKYKKDSCVLSPQVSQDLWKPREVYVCMCVCGEERGREASQFVSVKHNWGYCFKILVLLKQEI